jgi:integrase
LFSLVRLAGVEPATLGLEDEAQAEALIAALLEDLQDFVRWGLWCGWRKGEIASLKWADVDRDAGTIRLSLRKSKNGKARTIALAGELLRIIERRWAARTIATKSGATLLSTLVFHRGEGRGKYQGQAQPVGDFDKVFKTACAAAGIPYDRKAGYTFHCSRRSAARRMRRAGIPEATIMAITGHRTRVMFDWYNIIDERDTPRRCSSSTPPPRLRPRAT